MKTVIVIQARLGSSRLPCKTLLNLHGLPVIDWVVGRCARSELADDLVVALPDTRRDEVPATCGRRASTPSGDRNKTCSRVCMGPPPRTVRISWSACAPTIR